MLDADTLLKVWEKAESLPLLQRSMVLLPTAWPQLTPQAWAQVSVGKRDWHLLYLRQQLFGEQFDAVAHCPQCAEKLEMTFQLQQICPEGWDMAALEKMWQDAQGGVPENLLQASVWQGEGVLQTVRAPNTADLLASAALPTATAHQHLQAACFTLAAGATLADVGATERQQAMQAIAELDPLAEVNIGMQCPACGHAWQVDFDILAWLWNEIGDWVPRILQQVHSLALAYGWSEAAILAMPARRRKQYLVMCGAESS